MAFRRSAGVLGVVWVVASCGGGDPLPTVNSIEKVAATDGQSAPTEARLPVPLAVIAKASDGTPVPRVKVQWSIDAGAGTLSDSISLTDPSGRAQIDFTLGRAIGAYTVRARLGSNNDKNTSFTATAVAPPTLTSVTPSTFAGGDTVAVAGTALAASASVDVGGAPALVLSGSATGLSVVVPVCLPPGQVSIRARVNGGNSNTLNATYTSASTIRLAVGQYASIDPAQLSGCAAFPAAGVGGAEYLVAPQSTGQPGIATDYQLAGNTPVGPVAPLNEVTPEPPPTVAQQFHDFLRAEERRISMQPRVANGPAAAAPVAPAAAATIKIGDRKDFKVLNTTSGRYELQDFTKVTAVAKYVGSHVAIFQDVNAPSGGFTDAEFDPLGKLFNDVLYDLDTRAYGVETDVDNNGLVYMLLTPVVNRLTPAATCANGVVTGFFFSIDIDPGYATDARANQAEIFYSIVPDPSGTVTCTVPKSRINQIVPSTFVHEFQHMISYGQHVNFRKGLSEDTWLNEAMSHLAEEMAALKMKELGNDQAFSDYVIGNLFDAFVYLKAPGTTFTMYSDGGGKLAERGAGWLFLRWLTDKFGPNFTRRLEETNLIGVSNLANAAGEPLTRLFSQWFLANYVSDLPGITVDPRLTYDTWAFRTTYASLYQQNSQRFDRPFPLVPQVVNGGSFTTSDTLRAGSGDYFRVVQTAAQAGFTLKLTSSTGGALPASAVARLNVVRIK